MVEHVNDLDLLVRTAKESGFGGERSGLREIIWPLLVRVDPTTNHDRKKPRKKKKKDKEEELVQVRDGEQVGKDVERSMFLVSKEERPHQRARLRRVIHRVLGEDEELSYYQGFHDVVTVVLLVCKDEHVAARVALHLAQRHLRPMLRSDLSHVIRLLDLLFPLVASQDPLLHEFLVASGVQPFFALPWVLTWFSHSVASFATVLRLFDLFFACDPVMPLFVSAAVVLWTAPHVRHCECEYSAVHSFYSKLFSDISLRLNVEDVAVAEVPERPNLAALIDADLEGIIKRALGLRAKCANMLLLEAAQPFLTSSSHAAWTLLPSVRLAQLPQSACVPLENFRYRFEGVRRRRFLQQLPWTPILMFAFVVAVWLFMQWLNVRFDYLYKR